MKVEDRCDKTDKDIAQIKQLVWFAILVLLGNGGIEGLKIVSALAN